MKKNALAELKSRPVADLRKVITDTRKELAMAKLELKMNRYSNVHEVLNMRKKLAILQTVVREMELGGRK